MIGVEIFYSKRDWEVLKAKREKAFAVMEKLEKFGISSIVYGSTARGDVNPKSDVDVFIPELVPSFKIELALDGFEFLEKRIVQATPNYAIKGELVLDHETVVSFPLVKMRLREMDFYKFGGCLSYEELIKNIRVPGVDKRLMLILPTEKGHKEVSIQDMHPSVVAKILKVSIDIVTERIRVLGRRREIGRTGIYLSEKIPINECFESALRKIASRDPVLRKRVEA